MSNLMKYSKHPDIDESETFKLTKDRQFIYNIIKKRIEDNYEKTPENVEIINDLLRIENIDDYNKLVKLNLYNREHINDYISKMIEKKNKKKGPMGGQITKEMLGNENEEMIKAMDEGMELIIKDYGSESVEEIPIKKNRVEYPCMRVIRFNNEVEILYFNYNKTRSDTEFNKNNPPNLEYFYIPYKTWNNNKNWLTLNDYPDYEIFWNHHYQTYYQNRDDIKQHYSDENNYPNLIRDKETKDIIMETIHSTGYIDVCLPNRKDKNGNSIPTLKHQIIGRQFIKKPEYKKDGNVISDFDKNNPYTVVDHRKHNIWNNRLSNLQWVSQAENMLNKGNSKLGEIESVSKHKLPEDVIDLTTFNNKKGEVYDISEYVYSPSKNLFYRYQRIVSSNKHRYTTTKPNRGTNMVSLYSSTKAQKDPKHRHITVSIKQLREQYNLD